MAKKATTLRNAEKISITMTPDMLRAIRESVEAGEYASTSEALRDAVRVWQRQRIEDAERLTAARTRVRRSLDDPRPSVPLDEAFDRIEKLHAATLKVRRDTSAKGRPPRGGADLATPPNRVKDK
jgi:antitoxin ParD1/3/4